MVGVSSLRYFRLRGMHKQERLLARGCAIFWLAVLEAEPLPISPRISPYLARGCAIFWLAVLEAAKTDPCTPVALERTRTPLSSAVFILFVPHVVLRMLCTRP